MVRVSSFGQQQVLIQGIMDNQNEVFEGQRQISSGKKYDDYEGLAGKTNTVLGSRAFQARVESYQQTIDTISGKLDANDVQLSGMIEAMESLQESIQTTLANNTAEGFSELLDQTFNFISNGLNTNFDGTYLFSGAETGTIPVNVTELSDLAALPGVSDAFDNASVAFEARIADGVDLEFGLLASEIGEDVFQELLDLYNLDNGVNGPFEGELDSTQFGLLQAQLASIESAIDSVRAVQVSNGLAFERLEVVDEQHTDTVVFLETFISDIEDVDVAEAVTKLNNDQLALQISYQAVGSLSELSLLNFL